MYLNIRPQSFDKKPQTRTTVDMMQLIFVSVGYHTNSFVPR